YWCRSDVPNRRSALRSRSSTAVPIEFCRFDDAPSISVRGTLTAVSAPSRPTAVPARGVVTGAPPVWRLMFRRVSFTHSIVKLKKPTANMTKNPSVNSGADPDDQASDDGRRSRWVDHRRQRRDELVTMAVQAIVRHGPDVDMAQIAAVAGVSKPVLY